MKVTTEKPEPGVAALTVEVPPEDFDRAVDQAWRRIANRINVPGFRRGKAPRPLVERQVGQPAIDEEAMRRLLPEQYDAAVDETGIQPIDRPAFDILQFERGKPVIFKATVAVRPTVELGDYQQLEIKPDTVEVREEEVQNVLSRLQESQAQWVPVEDRGLEMGDQAIADLKIAFPDEGEGRPARSSDRTDAEVVLGENGYPEGFDAQLVGAKPGETKEFTLSWPWGPAPAPAAAAEPQSQEGQEGQEAQEGQEGQEAQEGQDAPAAEQPPAEPETRSATFTVTVKDIKRKELPELTDAFAKSLGEHESLAAMTRDVRRRLRDEALRAARVATENKTVDAAIEKATFEIPERLVEAETEALVREREQSLQEQRLTLQRYLQLVGQSEEDWRKEIRQQAERQLKARLVLDQLAEQEELDAAPEEVQEEIERTVAQYGEQGRQVRRTLSSDENRRRIATSLRRHKAIEKLVSYAGGYPEAPAMEGDDEAAGEAGDAESGEAAQTAAPAGQEPSGVAASGTTGTATSAS